MLVLEPDPSVESLGPELGLLLALFSLMFPLTSLQWVAAETEGVDVAADVPLMEPELDCAEAERTPHPTMADARSVVFKKFMRSLPDVVLGPSMVAGAACSGNSK